MWYHNLQGFRCATPLPIFCRPFGTFLCANCYIIANFYFRYFIYAMKTFYLCNENGCKINKNPAKRHAFAEFYILEVNWS